MEFLSLEEFTQSFFEKEKKNLENSYPGITLKRLKREISNILSEVYFDQENKSRSIFFHGKDKKISHLFDSLRKGIPLEYISKKAYFYKSSFFVNEAVLIPRNETEILVELAVKIYQDNFSYIKKRDVFKLLDVGVGSGAIILSLLQEINAPVYAYASDISKSAISVAIRNNFLLRYKYHSKSTLKFICSDRLEKIENKFHLILSNPPYINKKKDYHKVHSKVDLYEPHLALYIEDCEYEEWFFNFFIQVEKSLYEGGFFLMEGHEDHLQDQKEMLEKYNFKDIEIIKDYSGNNRFLKGIKKCKN